MFKKAPTNIYWHYILSLVTFVHKWIALIIIYTNHQTLDSHWYSIYLKKITWDTSKLNYPPPSILYSRIYFSQPPFLRFLVFTNKRRCVGVFSPTITEHDGIHKIIISFAPFSSQLRRLIELNCYIFLTIHALKSSHESWLLWPRPWFFQKLIHVT